MQGHAKAFQREEHGEQEPNPLVLRWWWAFKPQPPRPAAAPPRRRGGRGTTCAGRRGVRRRRGVPPGTPDSGPRTRDRSTRRRIFCARASLPYLLAGSVFQHSWCLLFILVFPLAHYRPRFRRKFRIPSRLHLPSPPPPKMTDAASCELQVVILYASVSSDVRHKSDTDALCALFEAKGVPHVMLDGVRCGLGRASHAARSTTPPSFSHSRFCLSCARAPHCAGLPRGPRSARRAVCAVVAARRLPAGVPAPLRAARVGQARRRAERRRAL